MFVIKLNVKVVADVNIKNRCEVLINALVGGLTHLYWI